MRIIDCSSDVCSSDLSVSAIIIRGASADKGREVVGILLGPFEREDKRKRGVEMGSGADGIGELGQVEVEAICEVGGKRRQRLVPFPVSMPRRLAMQRQQPGPAIGPLEPTGIGAEQRGADRKSTRLNSSH